jgi:hypothetical protein
MLDNQPPKIDNDFSNLTVDSLQQAWRGEAKQQRWRRAYLSTAIILLIIMITGLLMILWPTMRQNLAAWPVWFKNRTGQTLNSLKEWQVNNERSIIEGDILK